MNQLSGTIGSDFTKLPAIEFVTYQPRGVPAQFAPMSCCARMLQSIQLLLQRLCGAGGCRCRKPPQHVCRARRSRILLTACVACCVRLACRLQHCCCWFRCRHSAALRGLDQHCAGVALHGGLDAAARLRLRSGVLLHVQRHRDLVVIVLRWHLRVGFQPLVMHHMSAYVFVRASRRDRGHGVRIRCRLLRWHEHSRELRRGVLVSAWNRE